MNVAADAELKDLRKEIIDYIKKRLKDDLSAEEIAALAKLTDAISN